MGNNFPIKRDAYFLNSIHFELSPATSFDLDQSTILSFWNEILYLGKKILWEKKKILKISIFLFTKVLYIKKVTYIFNLTHLNGYLQLLLRYYFEGKKLKKTKTLVISIFFFYNNISYLKGYLLYKLHSFQIVICNPFDLDKSKILSLEKDIFH